MLLCGMRGTYGAGLALVARLVTLSRPLHRGTLCPLHRGALCVASMALGDIDVPHKWQAWHLVTSTYLLCGKRGTYGWLAWLPWGRGTSRGKRGTW